MEMRHFIRVALPFRLLCHHKCSGMHSGPTRLLLFRNHVLGGMENQKWLCPEQLSLNSPVVIGIDKYGVAVFQADRIARFFFLSDQVLRSRFDLRG